MHIGALIFATDYAVRADELAASLDRLSNGRFVFGIGGGWNREEMVHHGVDYGTRFARMEEQVIAMQRLWTRDAAGFDGRFVRFSESLLHPKPLLEG